MSDQSPPPKPKPGSLRDRIAAFEKSSTTSAPVPPPTRPKPAGGASWKPKPPSPPSSPRSTADNEKKPGSMSASDAKESIGRGGSLRERMAALQGRGGFGAPAPPVAPKPVEKPKWKPPPVVSPPVDEEGSEAHSRKSIEVDKPVEVATKDQDVDTSATVVEGVSQDEKPDDDEGHKEDADPEEEERQRRAAIAARIARLGGARVGMGPPVFGKPIPAKKPSLPLQEEAASEVPRKVEEPIASPPVVEEPAPSSTEADANAESNTPADDPAPKEATEQAESLSPPDASSPPHSRSPTSMPIPAVPRRAAPPRRKGAKSPAPPVEEHVDTPEVPSEVAQLLNQETLDTAAPVEASVASFHEPEDVSLTTKELIAELPATLDTAQAEPFTAAKPPADDTSNEPPSEEPKSPEEESSEPEQVAIPVPDDATSTQSPSFDQGLPHESEVHPEEAPAPERASIVQPETKEHERTTSSEFQSEEASDDKKEDEEDEVARRARVAARLAKMGAVNPFAPPPLRRDSHDAVSPTVATSGRQAGEDKDTPREEARSPPRNKAELPETEGIPSCPPPQLSSLPPSILPVAPKVDDAEEDDVHSSVDDETKENSDLTQSPAPPLERESIASSIHKPSDEVEHYHEDSTDMKQIPELPTSPLLNDNQDLEELPPPPPRHSRQSLPPPRRVLPEEPTEDEDVDHADRVAYDTVSSQPAGHPIHPHRHIPSPPVDDGLPPPVRLPPRRVTDDDDVVCVPQTHAVQEVSQGTPIRSSSISSNYSADLAGEAPPNPYPLRSVPPLRTSQVQPISDEPQTPSQASQPDDEALPTVPRFSPSHDDDDEQSDLLPSPPHKYKDEDEETEVISPVPPPRSFRPPQDVSDVSDLNTSVPEREVLDESEGDPIDPSFHSPISPKSSSINLRSEKSLEAIAPVVQLDDEQLKRQTIAERMAKLGGIRLGGAPPLMRKPPPTPKEDGTPDPVTEETPPEVITEEVEEEDEQARRQRILARLAGSGGMRLGMLPSALPQHNPAPPKRQSEELPVPPPPPRRVSHVPVDPRCDDAETPPPPPPHRILHPTRSSPSVETDSEQDSQTFSDDGVKVEAEESELEEVSHEDAEAPPPIPVRIGRHPSIDSTNTVRDPPARKPSLPPAGRPPVPKVNLTTRRTSGDSGHQVRPTPPPQSDYVMVEESTSEPEEVPPPPPPPRIGSRPPAPSRHVPQPPATEGTDLTVSQWELPSIPSTAIDFGGDEPDLSLSNWSEDSTAFVSPPSAAPLATPPHTARSESHFPSAEDRPRTSDELIAVWGRVGVQICEVATTLFEKSKKALIGDGTYPGFLHAVLSEVPNAAPPRVPLDYGVVIYVQVANAVQKRLADIMPGDVIFLQDVKLKGHKGLQTYHQSVGTDEPVVGVVSDFEAKKSKVRVFQANQHVGQQTVESVSYRLEDVKSGVVKVFRVLEV